MVCPEVHEDVLCLAFTEGNPLPRVGTSGELCAREYSQTATDVCPFGTMSNAAGFSLLACVVIITIVGVVTNMWVIVVFLNDRLLWRANHFLLFTLAVSDVLASALAGLHRITSMLVGNILTAEACHVVGYAVHSLVLVSFLNIFLVALNRYVQVCHRAYVYQRVFSTASVTLQCIAIWTFGFLAFIRLDFSYSNAAQGCVLDASKQSTRIRVYIFVSLYAMVVVADVVVYYKLALTVTRFERKAARGKKVPLQKTSRKALSSRDGGSKSSSLMMVSAIPTSKPVLSTDLSSQGDRVSPATVVAESAAPSVSPKTPLEGPSESTAILTQEPSPQANAGAIASPPPPSQPQPAAAVTVVAEHSSSSNLPIKPSGDKESSSSSSSEDSASSSDSTSTSSSETDSSDDSEEEEITPVTKVILEVSVTEPQLPVPPPAPQPKAPPSPLPTPQVCVQTEPVPSRCWLPSLPMSRLIASFVALQALLYPGFAASDTQKVTKAESPSPTLEDNLSVCGTPFNGSSAVDQVQNKKSVSTSGEGKAMSDSLTHEDAGHKISSFFHHWMCFQNNRTFNLIAGFFLCIVIIFIYGIPAFCLLCCTAKGDGVCLCQLWSSPVALLCAAANSFLYGVNNRHFRTSTRGLRNKCCPGSRKNDDITYFFKTYGDKRFSLYTNP